MNNSPKIVFSEICIHKVAIFDNNGILYAALKEKLITLKKFPQIYETAEWEEYREMAITVHYKCFLIAYFWNETKNEIFIMNIRNCRQEKYTNY